MRLDFGGPFRLRFRCGRSCGGLTFAAEGVARTECELAHDVFPGLTRVGQNELLKARHALVVIGLPSNRGAARYSVVQASG